MVFKRLTSWDAGTEMAAAPLEPNWKSRLIEEVARLQGLNHVDSYSYSEKGSTKFSYRSSGMFDNVVPESSSTAESLFSEVSAWLESYEQESPSHMLSDHHWTESRFGSSGDFTIGKETNSPLYLESSTPPKMISPWRLSMRHTRYVNLGYSD